MVLHTQVQRRRLEYILSEISKQDDTIAQPLGEILHNHGAITADYLRHIGTYKPTNHTLISYSQGALQKLDGSVRAISEKKEPVTFFQFFEWRKQRLLKRTLHKYVGLLTDAQTADTLFATYWK
jgi:hypothetical protein